MKVKNRSVCEPYATHTSLMPFSMQYTLFAGVLVDLLTPKIDS